MPKNGTSEVLRGLLRELPDAAELTDAQLLERYLSRREEAAFAALVRRHGPMVWGVCRRVLGNHHDAEDAFQAAFLVFVRKAASIVPREMLPNWLHGVAHRTARKAQAVAARRKQRERQVIPMPEPAPAPPDPNPTADLQPLIDQELSRLPAKYRVAIVLCDLEGKTRKEAARQLGCPEGTVAARLARGRVMLARRLARHGVAPAGGLLTAALAQGAASACVPAAVVSAVVRAGTMTAGGGTAEVVSAQVAALAEGVLNTMLTTKFKVAAALLLVVAVTAAGVGAAGLLSATWAADPPNRAGADGGRGTPPARKADADPEDMVKAAQARRAIEEQRLTVIVDDALRQARARYPDRPDKALTLLRDTLVQVWDNPDISERMRDDLLAQLTACRRELTSGEEQGRPVWNLDLRFKNPRMIAVDVPGQGRKTVWYLWYEVTNNTGEAHTFVPDFELVAGDKVHRDVVLPAVQEAIRRLEDPTKVLDIKNSVTISADPIPPRRRSAEERRVAGIALWEGVSPNVREVTIFVSGLSKAWSRSENMVRRKVLKLSFKRADDEMLPTGPAEWVYRTVKEGPDGPEEPQEEVKRLIRQVSDRISLVEQEEADWERKRERLLMQLRLTEGEIEKAAGKASLQADLAKKKKELEREIAGCDDEGTARALDRLSQKKRLEELEKLLPKAPGKPPRGP